MPDSPAIVLKGLLDLSGEFRGELRVRGTFQDADLEMLLDLSRDAAAKLRIRGSIQQIRRRRIRQFYARSAVAGGFGSFVPDPPAAADSGELLYRTSKNP